MVGSFDLLDAANADVTTGIKQVTPGPKTPLSIIATHDRIDIVSPFPSFRLRRGLPRSAPALLVNGVSVLLWAFDAHFTAALSLAQRIDNGMTFKSLLLIPYWDNLDDFPQCPGQHHARDNVQHRSSHLAYRHLLDECHPSFSSWSLWLHSRSS